MATQEELVRPPEDPSEPRPVGDWVPIQRVLFDMGLDPADTPAATDALPVEHPPPRQADAIHPAMRAALGPVGNVLEECFRRVALAEEAIARLSAQHPRRARQLHGAFRILCWRLQVSVCDEVYIAHAEELLERVVKDEDTSFGTHAEVLVCLSTLSLRAPFAAQPAALFALLFRRIFKREVNFDSDHDPREPWKGANDELLSELRRKLRLPDRQLH
jgi:hypothetical protein